MPPISHSVARSWGGGATDGKGVPRRLLVPAWKRVSRSTQLQGDVGLTGCNRLALHLHKVAVLLSSCAPWLELCSEVGTWCAKGIVSFYCWKQTMAEQRVGSGLPVTSSVARMVFFFLFPLPLLFCSNRSCCFFKSLANLLS